ncbi:hypothetical protein HMPREF0663_10917 [Hoylesella oralis ATCC 33269]|uniref:Uncharacterized protein n=1 Tax=Hoylesella oralis ATCC 33269 TaxID=873533 RepID=E7RP16_9BACT|nr:hypothetical protein HMPREF0663_10917 [Hoylesella oralis ATCC 33269]
MKKNMLTEHITPIYSTAIPAILHLVTKFIMTNNTAPFYRISAFTYTQSIMLPYLYLQYIQLPSPISSRSIGIIPYIYSRRF